MARPRKPTHLKVLAGEKRPSRLNPEEPVARKGVASPPDWLSERASEHFMRLSGILNGMGIASPDDIDNLAMLASRLEEVEICTAILEDAGRVYVTVNTTGSEMLRARPEVGMRNEAMRHAQALLNDFGLSPAARSKVKAGASADENPFSALDRAG